MPDGAGGGAGRPRGRAAHRLDPRRGPGAGRERARCSSTATPVAKSRRLEAGERDRAARRSRRCAGPARSPTRRSTSWCATRTPTSSWSPSPRASSCTRAPVTPTARSCNGLLARYPELADVGDPARPGHRPPARPRHERPARGRALAARPTTGWSRCSPPTTSSAATSRWCGARSTSPRGVIDAPDRPVGPPPHAHGGPRGRSRAPAPPTRSRAAYRDPVVSLLECRLETGRTHQIRVHLQAIGHPVVGDAAYGGAAAGARPRPPVPPRRRARVRAPGHRGAGRGRGAAAPELADVLDARAESTRDRRSRSCAEDQSSASAPGGVVVDRRRRRRMACACDRRPSRCRAGRRGSRARSGRTGRSWRPGATVAANAVTLSAPAVASSLRRCTRLACTSAVPA